MTPIRIRIVVPATPERPKRVSRVYGPRVDPYDGAVDRSVARLLAAAEGRRA